MPTRVTARTAVLAIATAALAALGLTALAPLSAGADDAPALVRGVSAPGEDGSYAPMEEFTVELTVDLAAGASEPVVAPSIIALLPGELEYVSWTTDTTPNVVSFTQAGQQLTFSWPTTMTPDGTDQQLAVEVTVRVRANVAAVDPSLIMTFVVGTQQGCPDGWAGDESGFGLDDGDGVAEPACQYNHLFAVESTPVLGGEHWVRSPNFTPDVAAGFPAASDSAAWPYDECVTSRFEYPAGSGDFWFAAPCAVLASPEAPYTSMPPTGPFTAAAPNSDQIRYLIDVRNDGNEAFHQYELVEELPRAAEGDAFDVYLTGPVIPSTFSGIVNAGNTIIEYSTDGSSYSPTFPTAQPRSVTHFRIAFAANMQAAVGARMLFTVPALVAYDAVPGGASWASYEHSAASTDSGDEVGPVASPEAGVRVADRLSIGNRVWRDADRSSTISGADDTNPGIANVTLGLYEDADANGIPDGASLATTTTDASGYYLFDDLLPGRYLVVVEGSNFSGGALSGLRSSPGAQSGVDSADAGVDPINPGDPVFSSTIELDFGDAPVGESDRSDSHGPLGAGFFGATDDSSTLAVDFGFVGGTYTVGDMVWFDDGFTGSGYSAPLRNDGTRTIGENGAGGVTVQLFRDGNGNGEPDAPELMGTTTTIGNGAYGFTDLAEGDYIVVLPASQFASGAPLEGWHSSSLNGAVDSDHYDKGLEPSSRRPDLSGIRSILITLDDSRTDGLIDFGLIPPMAIGDRVWLDDSSDPAQWGPGGSRNNGLVDATDDGNLTLAGLQNAGIVGVNLELHYDENNNGIIDDGDTHVANATTVSGGAYVFDGLAPGNYLVRLPSGEFATGEPLNGLVSSFDAVSQSVPTNQTNDNDNGVDNIAPATNGIASRQIQLVYFGESTSDGTTTTLAANADADLTVDFGFLRAPLSIGNQVWLDDHATTAALRNNGILNSGEPGIAGVEVALYRDLNSNGVVDAGEDTGLRDTTDANGYYLFGNVPAGSYIVAVTAANFGTGGPLENTISAQSVAPNPIANDNGVDSNDNGRDSFVTGVGIISSRIALAYGAEATGESPLNTPADGPSGRGTHGERDSDSDLTVDFGFYTPFSIGNRVWLDDSDSPANWPTSRNNALLDPSTDDLDNPNIPGVQGLGVAGVTLRLYRDFDADGVLDAGEDTGRTVTTNATGYYLFDGLPRGDYLVSVEASNFASGRPLSGFSSSLNATAPTDNNVDGTDDGVGLSGGVVPSPVFGVVSPSILLSYASATTGDEPTGASETDPVSQSQADRGANAERDDFSNLTVDFGFARPATVLSGAVFDDDASASQAERANGVRDAGEPGIPGVQVELFRDLNGNDVIDAGEETGLSTPTDASGEFAFTVLAGDYLVRVTAANFASGEVLEGTLSSTGGEVLPISGSAVAFGYFDSLALGDAVWLDDSDDPATWLTTRDNAVLDPEDDLGEAEGVTLRLYADLDGDGVVDSGEDTTRTATTNEFGVYLFEGVVRGDYIVAVEAENFAPGGALEGFASSTDTATPVDDGVDGVDDGIGTTPDATLGILSPSIDLQASELSIDFGFARAWSFHELGGRVAFDSDLDGVVGAADDYVPGGAVEAGIPGVGVGLFVDEDADGEADSATAFLTTTTGSDGSYGFEDVPAGDWVVVLTGGAGSPIEGLQGDLSSGAVALADDVEDADFLFSLPVTLSGEIWIDRDGDGVRDAGDSIAADGTAVALLDAADPSTPLATTTTVGGAYSFAGIGAGEYVITSSVIGHRPDDRTVTVAPDGSDPGSATIDEIDLVLVPLVAIGDTAWHDLDRDGLQEIGEPGIPGVEVRLLTTAGAPATDVEGDAVAAVATDANGRYLFANLLPGDYRVEFGTVADYGRAPQGAGAADIDSNADPVTGRSGVVTVHGLVGGTVQASPATLTHAYVDSSVDAGYQLIQWDLGVALDYAGIDLDASTIEWDLTVGNEGPDAAPGPITVELELPAGLAFASSSSSAVDCAAVGQLVTCTHDDPLPAGASFDVTIVTSYTGDPSGLRVTATVDGGAGDPVASNDSRFAEVPAGVIPSAPPAALPTTGLDVAPFAGGALALVLGGLALWFVRRLGVRRA